MNEIVFIALWLALWTAKVLFCVVASGMLFVLTLMFATYWILRLLWTHRK